MKLLIIKIIFKIKIIRKSFISEVACPSLQLMEQATQTEPVIHRSPQAVKAPLPEN